jgi:transposase
MKGGSMPEVCPSCNETELEGDLGVEEGELEDSFVIAIVEVGRRNWICCDSCNRVVCHNCCSHAKSGYCDSCIEKYNLHDLIRDIEEAV